MAVEKPIVVTRGAGQSDCMTSAQGNSTTAAQEDAVIVIDDFLADPLAVRQLALDAEYPNLGTPQTYPGRYSKRTYPLPGLDDAIAEITGSRVVPQKGTSHGGFRVCLADEMGTGHVHIDNSHWTGVLYLTLDEHAHGGTDFFRHRPTGTLRAPVYPEDWAAWGKITPQTIHREVILPHTNDASQWDLVRHVPMKFNRLVLFQPWLWHAAGPGFGDSVANARVIYLMSYNEV
jgi:hypothetical protein